MGRAQSSKAHTNMQKYIIDAGFDMNATAKNMEEYYLEKEAQIREKNK